MDRSQMPGQQGQPPRLSQEDRRKRLREALNMDAQPSETPPTPQPPQWVLKTMNKHLTDVTKIFQNMIVKENGIQALEDMLNNNTAPKSLHIKCNIQVEERYQEGLDQIIKQAELDYQKTVLNGILQARRKEHLDVKKEVQELEREWKVDVHTTLTQLNEAGLNPYPHVTIDHTLNEWIHILKTKQDQVERDLKTKNLLKRRAKTKFDAEKAARQQEQTTNMILEDSGRQPTTRRDEDSRIKVMESRLKKMERQLASALPKGTAKPTSQVGGGKGKKTVQKPTQGNAGKGGKAKPGAGKDKPGRPGPSKRSTRQ